MIDNCKGIILYDSEQEAFDILNKPPFKLIKSGTSSYTGEVVHTLEFQNLHVKYYPLSKTVKFENSLQKFKHGNNFCDFSFTDLYQTCEDIAVGFRKPMNEIRVSHFEFALIVNTILEPEFYFSRFSNFKLKPFYDAPPPYGFSKPLLKYCPFGQYTIKFYNTGKWNRVSNQNLLKGEIKFLKMEKVYKLTGRNATSSPIVLSDLANKEFLKTLNANYLIVYDKIEKAPFLDSNQFSERERNFLFAGLSPEYWAEEKSLNSETAKKKRHRYKLLRDEVNLSGNVPFHSLRNSFEQKFDHLILS